MFANGQCLIVLATLFVAKAHAQENELITLDDIFGEKYVSSDEVRAAKMDMMARGNGYGTDWIVMPDGNGDPDIAILSFNWGGNRSKSSLDRTAVAITTLPEEAVTLRLFTRNNHGIVMDKSNLDSMDFDGSKPTKIVIHGWRSSDESETVTSIREAYLEMSDVNVLTVDWSKPAGNIFYPASAAYTKTAGKYIGQLIDDLVNKNGARYEDIHVIGHSLGAHVAGVAGQSTACKVARITGLDPALPGFADLSRTNYRLDETDAEFVDVIHTCAGSLGMSTPVGHADFYPNGGTPFQPGCCCITELTGVCSHGRSHKYFAESITSENAFEGIRCKSYEQFTENNCGSFVVPMGEHTPTTARGVFYLETDSASPFGLGFEGTKCTHST